MTRTRDAALLAADEGAKQGQPDGLRPTREPVGELRGYGNAIHPQVAAAFVTASLTYNV